MYPTAPHGEVVDDHFGELVADPFRSLEDPDAPTTIAWVEAENALTEEYLATVGSRPEIAARLEQLWDYPRVGVPFERGGRFFQFRNSGLQNQPVLYVMEEPDAPGVALLDPNELSPDGTVAITAVEVTDDGSLLAYATSAHGSDWMTWRVREVATRLDREDVLEWSKFSGAAWRLDGEGFFYGAPERPEGGDEYVAELRGLAIRYHRLGTPQSVDEVVYAAPEEPEWLPHAVITEDGRYLVVAVSRGTFPESRIFVRDLEAGEDGFLALVPTFAAKAAVIANRDREFFLLTDDGAERQQVVAVDLDRPDKITWRVVVPEAEDTLLEVHEFGGRMLCHYLHDAYSRCTVHDFDGSLIHEVPLPGIGTMSSIAGRRDDPVVRFEWTSFNEPGALFEHDLERATTTRLRASAAAIDPDDFEIEQVFVASDDGTPVPMFLTRRRDLVPDGEAPVLLTGYGGFDIPLTPAFSLWRLVFVERGGILAVANLRGGGEYGRRWHDTGRLALKQNVFDDFAACARHLAASGWSRPGRIAINGGSNGGLLVGACLTQHPELYGAAVPEVGVLDMLRFHKFTIGWAWTSDFGDPDDPEQYGWVRAYSPLHNIVAGTAYPATLVVTGDHDDRVVPGHSLKFAATLQEAQGGDAPILIRIETSGGHGAGKPTAKVIAERSDVLAFLESTIGRSPTH